MLTNLGIGVQIEPKNITYFYPGFENGVRGKRLGRHYDKPGLQRKFKENDELFQKHPDLRANLPAKIEAAKSLNGEGLKLKYASAQPSGKDYGEYTKTRRGDPFTTHQSDRELKNSIIPFDEIQRARQGNIIEYCKRNKIDVIQNDKGERVLKKREFVALSDNHWVNKKNNTEGSLIEFVAAHHKCSFLKAIAKINDSPRLLLLEKHLGEETRAFQSFYIPKPDQVDLAGATKKVEKFLAAFGAKPEGAMKLLQSGRVQVGKEGSLRFLPLGEPSGALEFTEQKDGKWTKRVKGQIRNPFHLEPGRSRRTVVFTDPVSFIKAEASDLFSDRKRHDGVLVLMEPNKSPVDKYLGQNTHVNRLTLFSSPKEKLSPVELDFFNNLKRAYPDFGIEIDTANESLSLKRGGPKIKI
jgi:hypothetical protein